MAYFYKFTGNFTVTFSLLLILGLVPLGAAQTFGVALSYDGVLEPEVQLRELDLGAAALDVRVAGGSGPLELGAALRSRSSFGPLGTVSVVAHADADTAGAFELGADAAGTLAGTGVDASLSIFNRNPGAFSPTTAYALDSRPFLPPVGLLLSDDVGTGAYLAIGATQRLGRTLLLEATPALSYQSGVGLGAGFDARLQLRRLVESDNGVVLLEGNTGPGAGRTFLAAGAEYQLNRRGLPALSGALLLGSGETGIQPGFRGSAVGEAGRFSYRAELAAEPYRATAPPYRADLSVGTALGPGALGLELGAALANDFGVPPLLLRGTYAFRF